MDDRKQKMRYPLIHKIFILIGISWTIFIAFLYIWNVKNEKIKSTVVTLAEARSFFKHITTTRYWNSLHGGVYVPVTKQTQPNPFLDVPRRDVVTEDGQLLTLINPAYMTRQISKIASNRDQVQFHITSLKPIRSGNDPDEWEPGPSVTFRLKQTNIMTGGYLLAIKVAILDI